MLTDELLFKQFQEKKDQSILAKLYLRHTEMVYLVSMKYLNNEDKSKDVVMDIYYQLAVADMSTEIKSFRNWLFIVTRNHCLHVIRNDKKIDTVEFNIDQFMHPADNLDHSIKLEDERRLDLIDKCIERLSDDQKNGIVLFYKQKKCYQEISNILNIDKEKVRSHIQNGRRNLKNCVESYE